MLNIIVLGAPGAGKGTQSKLIADKYGLCHIATGDLIREEIASGSELGKLAASLIDHGNMVPDEVAIDMLIAKLNRNETQNGYVFDGFPRNLQQAHFFSQFAQNNLFKLHRVIYLEADKDLLTTRLLNRGKILNRPDDRSEEIINLRFQLYNQKTYPVISYYLEQNICSIVQSNQSVNNVFTSICEIIDTFD